MVINKAVFTKAKMIYSMSRGKKCMVVMKRQIKFVVQ